MHRKGKRSTSTTSTPQRAEPNTNIHHQSPSQTIHNEDPLYPDITTNIPNPVYELVGPIDVSQGKTNSRQQNIDDVHNPYATSRSDGVRNSDEQHNDNADVQHKDTATDAVKDIYSMPNKIRKIDPGLTSSDDMFQDDLVVHENLTYHSYGDKIK